MKVATEHGALSPVRSLVPVVAAFIMFVVEPTHKKELNVH